MRLVVIVLAAAMLAACVPTPKPFEHSGANDRAYKPQDDKAEVTIASPTNMPPEMGQRVATALAMELQAYGIVATVGPAAAPLRVSGVMSTRDAPVGTGIEIEVDWSLSGNDGKQGPAAVKTVARPEDYAAASDRLVSRLAQMAAPQISTLMGRPPVYEARSLGQVAAGLSIPPEAPPDTVPARTGEAVAAASVDPAVRPAAKPTPGPTGPAVPQVRVRVAPVTGAPSDGDRQLFSGMRRALGSSRIVVMDKPGADVFTIIGAVSLTPIDDQSTRLSVTWILKDPAGREVGKVQQGNPVSVAATRGSWAGFGDIVAAAAVEGVLELLDKALQARQSPPHHGTSP
jgi:hypothetical protein